MKYDLIMGWVWLALGIFGILLTIKSWFDVQIFLITILVLNLGLYMLATYSLQKDSEVKSC